MVIVSQAGGCGQTVVDADGFNPPIPKARQLVKYLVADGRYDYLETGSLVGKYLETKGFEQADRAKRLIFDLCRSDVTKFYSRSDTSNRKNMMEIEFLVSGLKKPFPIEVKSGR